MRHMYRSAIRTEGVFFSRVPGSRSQHAVGPQREPPGSVIGHREGDAWTRAFTVISWEGRGDAGEVGLGLAGLSNSWGSEVTGTGG